MSRREEGSECPEEVRFSHLPPDTWQKPPPSLFAEDALTLAGKLLGCLLVHTTATDRRSGVMVETEAYMESEPSCHAWGGPTERNRPMFARGGLAYVYLSYGIHHCFNVGSGGKGRGEAVLVRAMEPCEGLEMMSKARGGKDLSQLCSGPGKLCQAMGIDLSHNGVSLTGSSLGILVPRERLVWSIGRSARIGITKAADLPYRFYVKGSPFLSRSSS
ncbi:DNA-3-methyladenine glycosylase [Candidatus Fermentibacteria bacterium]|nr:DNA-3-methyladenine glycosylase [Candidatus Fermentibacteria bacterium]